MNLTLNLLFYLLFKHQFMFLGGNISFTESDVDTRIVKALTATDSLKNIWKYDLSDDVKRESL